MTIGPAKCRGLTLVEVIASLVILGLGMTAGVQALGSFAMAGRSWRERSVAQELANSLMAQINALPFEDPSGPGSLGRDAGELEGQWLTFDDVDDFNGWNMSPPRNSAGQPMTDYPDYRQQVAVAYETSLPGRLGQSFPAGTFKKITVTISRKDKVLAQLVTIRARQKSNIMPEGSWSPAGPPGGAGGNVQSVP